MGADLSSRVAIVTGGAGGLGAATCRALAAQGARIVVADVDETAGQAIADEVGGRFQHVDVASFEDNQVLMQSAADHEGGVDLVFLNAGVATFTEPGAPFDPERYRRAMAINLDGVVYGAEAALPHLQARGGGAIVATASLAGLTGVPMDPYYCANKHGVVGLVRALGPAWLPHNVRVNAVCPGFAESRIVDPIREGLAAAGVELIPAEVVADTVVHLFAGDMAGECWFIQPHRPPAAFTFRNVPGPGQTTNEEQ